MQLTSAHLQPHFLLMVILHKLMGQAAMQQACSPPGLQAADVVADAEVQARR